MIFRKETVDFTYPKIKQLALNHHKEVKDFNHQVIEMDKRSYLDLERRSILRLYVVELDEEIIGYATFILFNNHHLGGQLQANQDAIFISNKFRGIGTKFIAYTDEQLKLEGVEVVYHHVKPQVDWSKALLRLDYKHIENIYAKNL